MFRRENIEFLNVFSILLLSLWANFIFQLEFDFSASIDLVELVKGVSLSISSVSSYFLVLKLRFFETLASKEYHSEQKLEDKAAKSIASRYNERINDNSVLTHSLAMAMLLGLLCFMFLNPIINFSI